MRIDLAYCIEISKVVDIYAACLEFSLQSKHLKFHFLCSDPDCRQSKSADGGVRVTGVNHQTLPEDENVTKSPHYRKWDTHSDECSWVSIDQVLNDISAEYNPDSAFIQLKKVNQRLISRFVLPDSAEDCGETSVDELQCIKTSLSHDDKKNRIRAYIQKTGSTATSLESLVSCYEKLLAIKKSYEALTILGHGSTTYKDFFRQLKYARLNSFSVFYGVAKFGKYYGDGFTLNFFDRYEGLPVTLYLSSAMINSSKLGKHFHRIIKEAEENSEKRAYLKVYWLGTLDRQEKSCGAVIKSLSHIVMRIAYPKQKIASFKAES